VGLEAVMRDYAQTQRRGSVRCCTDGEVALPYGLRMYLSHIAGLSMVSLLCACAATGASTPSAGSLPSVGLNGPLSADPALLSIAMGGSVVATPPPVAPVETAPVAGVQPVSAPLPPLQTSRQSETSAAAAGSLTSLERSPAKPVVTDERAARLVARAVSEPAASAPSRPVRGTGATTPDPVAEPLRKAEAVTAPVAAPKTPAPPTLDIAELKSRLRDTKAIGVFSKLALKNQMDDVLEQFRAAYKTGQKTAPAALRQPYDMLVLKVLALLQDGDPALARSVAGSREALWGMLADAEKFRTLA